MEIHCKICGAWITFNLKLWSKYKYYKKYWCQSCNEWRKSEEGEEVSNNLALNLK